MILLSLLALTFRLSFASATNTTDHVGFVPEPSCGRGTVGILWKCLTTIFLCVFTVLHLNIPVAPLSKWQRFGLNIKWCFIAVLAPELICTWAILDWTQARKLKELLRRRGYAKVTLQQAFFLRAGGLLLSVPSTQDDSKTESNIAIRSTAIHRVLQHFESQENDPLEMIMENMPNDIEIEDRSKVDVLAKVIACIQAFWVASTVIARLALSLSVSLLEAVTVAYVICALISYICWFAKPYGVNVSKHLQLQIPATFMAEEWGPTALQDSNGIGLIETLESMTYGYDYCSIYMPSPDWTISLVAMVFSAFHCIAWGYSFPTAVEARIWQISSLIIGAPPLCLLLVFKFLRSINVAINWIAAIFVGFYTVARLLLIVEIFISFRSAPADMYHALQWPSYIGHIGS